MAHTYHMPKLHNVPLWGKHANIYATYEVVCIRDVTRITVHTGQLHQQHYSPITHTEFATWPNQSNLDSSMTPLAKSSSTFLLDKRKMSYSSFMWNCLKLQNSIEWHLSQRWWPLTILTTNLLDIIHFINPTAEKSINVNNWWSCHRSGTLQ